MNRIKVGILTLGCKVNQYESEVFAEALENEGASISDFNAICDIYIINTCTVTAQSDRKAGQMIRRAVNANPEAFIIVTGCYAEAEPDKIAAISGVSCICGNRSKLTAVRMAIEFMRSGVKPSKPIIFRGGIETADFEKMSINKFERTRAYVKIEDGCDGKCTYCIIPSVRGKTRSKPIEDALNEIKVLTAGGCKEVVLTGIETSAYEYGLSELLKRVNEIEGLERIRMGSLDPSFMRTEFIDNISVLEKVVPHFHLSMQSGSDKILAAMKRRYNTEIALHNMNYIKSKIPSVLFTTDIMTGFPNETDDDFQATVNFVKYVKFLHIHIFTYSKRPNTPAAVMDGQIPESIKVKRASILSETQKTIKAALLNDIVNNTSLPTKVLFETFQAGYSIGHSGNFVEYSVKTESSYHGKIFNVMPSSTDGERIYGVMII